MKVPRCTSTNGRHAWTRIEGGGLRERKCQTCGALGNRIASGRVLPLDYKSPVRPYVRRSARGIPRGRVLPPAPAQAAPLDPILEQRPRTRGDCSDVVRPCPWVGCRYNLYLDINPQSGSIKLNYPAIEPGDMAESCALDVAARGGMTLEGVSLLLNLTRERVRQIEARALLGQKLADFRKEAA